MSVQQVSTEDLKNFLRVSKTAIMEVKDGGEIVWFVGGVEYSEAQALKLAEYCFLTGQVLTSIATIEGALNVARRCAAAEKGIANLNFVITELKLEIDALQRRSHDHWWH